MTHEITEFDPDDDYQTARDVDPLLDFDPIQLYWRKWVWKEVDRTWREATGGTRSPELATMDDLGELHSISLILGIESVLKMPLLANMHLFTGSSLDEFVDFVMAQREAQTNPIGTGPTG